MLMLTPAMDSVAVHEWQAPLVVEPSNEMYGTILWKFLPSMDGRNPWAMQHV